ncbi:ROK family transcriptional regulator [Alicyclobacillus fastidiosus]|uniref:ROK family transcriptional regulator n=1 Tax=Alicyclobacillus fastidiosus TaxID=392011 RepID=A0ABY6ZCJ6_9BACL|nr:ROK family transcriptional regulator [Alicyclobacillus fastidiosus]WAH40609.1 ROK family transcriptional regulator [Alicyclobacillus fastidiosus]GMA62050.1 transcriptional regulator [Alicyclobacillus fastidiosus]
MTTKGTAVLRVHNEKRIMSFLRQNKTTSRQAIADSLGISKNTVSIIIEKLLKEGVVSESGIDQGEVGRPRIELSLIAKAYQVIGILIRDTCCEIVVTDYSGNIMESEAVEVNAKMASLCLNLLAERCQRLIRKYDRVIGIGIAVPGLVDPTSGLVHYSTHLEWEGIPVMQVIQQHVTPIPVRVLNRVKAASLSRFKVTPDNSSSTFYIRVDEGVGGAFVIGNEIYHGTSWTAGEVGHLPVATDGPRCICGQHGCLEALVSIPAVRRQLKARIPDRDIDITADGIIIPPSLSDYPEFHAVMDDVGAYVGVALSTVINLLNPQVIVVDSPYSNIPTFGSATIKTAGTKALQYPLKNTQIVFVNTVHSSAIGVALAVILGFENTSGDA